MTEIRRALKITKPTERRLERIINVINRYTNYRWSNGNKLDITNDELKGIDDNKELWLYFYEDEDEDNYITYSIGRYVTPWSESEYATLKYEYGSPTSYTLTRLIDEIKKEEVQEDNAMEKEEPEQLDTYKLQELFETGVNITEQINYHKNEQEQEEIALDKFLKDLKETLGGL